MRFHVSIYGPKFAPNFRADVEGYIATTVREVRALRWQECPTRDQVREIVAANKAAKIAADRTLAEWRREVGY